GAEACLTHRQGCGPPATRRRGVTRGSRATNGSAPGSTATRSGRRRRLDRRRRLVVAGGEELQGVGDGFLGIDLVEIVLVAVVLLFRVPRFGALVFFVFGVSWISHRPF